MNIPPRYQKWLILGAVVLCHTFFWTKLKHLHLSDPDTFIYQSLARETSQRGLLTTLPQVEDLGWNKVFADKNILFNAVNGLFYKIAGERGVEFSLFLMSLGVGLGLFFGAAFFVPLPWAALLTLAGYVNAHFAIRLFLMRPHVWAIFCFLGVLLAILHRAPAAALVFGALFGWGYPVFYLPLALLALAFAVYGLRRNESDRTEMAKVAQWGGAGVLLSMVVHPAFPANLDWVRAISQIAVNSMALATVELPIENVPHRSDAFFLRFTVSLLILVGSLAYEFAARRDFKSERRRQDFIFLWIVNAGLWVAAFFQPRAAEYATPVTLILAALWLGRLLEVVEPRRAAVALVAIVVLGNYTSLTDFYARGPKFSLNPKVPVAVMAAIPKEAAGKKVFNCEWESGAFLLYRRPDLRFVDLLDPTFLPKSNPSLALQRKYLFDGKLQPYPVIHDSFQADYVVCRNPELLSRLDVDPLFTRIFPPMPERIPQEVAAFSGVYRVMPERLSHFVQAAYVTSANVSALPVRPAHTRTVASQNDLQTIKGPYWNLVPFAQKAEPGQEPTCLQVRPTESELARLQGSDWLAVGGGPEILVALNGKPLARSKDDDGNSDSIRDWIQLPQKLKAKDELTFMVCSGKRDAYHGVGISFWTAAERQSICVEKGFAPAIKGDSPWKYTFTTPADCFGRVAVNNP